MANDWQNILLVAGTGQNVGKTTLICQLLEELIPKQPIAIKTTTHFHEETPGLRLLFQSQGFRLFEETNRHTDKDSSLFLQHGADRSLYLQTSDQHLEEAFVALLPYLDPDRPILIESGSLHKYLRPGLFVVIYREKELKKPAASILLKIADRTIKSDGSVFLPSPTILKFENQWTIRE